MLCMFFPCIHRTHYFTYQIGWALFYQIAIFSLKFVTKNCLFKSFRWLQLFEIKFKCPKWKLYSILTSKNDWIVYLHTINSPYSLTMPRTVYILVSCFGLFGCKGNHGKIPPLLTLLLSNAEIVFEKTNSPITK